MVILGLATESGDSYTHLRPKGEAFWRKGEAQIVSYERPEVQDLGSISDHTYTGYFPGGSGVHCGYDGYSGCSTK